MTFPPWAEVNRIKRGVNGGGGDGGEDPRRKYGCIEIVDLAIDNKYYRDIRLVFYETVHPGRSEHDDL